jgi:hypothetical protein
MTSSNTPYLILLLLTLVVIGIYLYQSRYDNFETMTPDTSTFPDTTMPMNNMPQLINLPEGDTHLITDNNPELVTTSILNYKLQVMKKDSNALMDVYISVFMHSPFEYNNRKYLPLGQFIKVSHKPLDISDINSNTMKEILNRKCIYYLCAQAFEPIDYKLVWTSDTNTDGQIFSAWKPMVQTGVVALGDVIIAGTTKPPRSYMACLPSNMVEPVNVSNGIIWQAVNDLKTKCFCWGAGNFDTFKVTSQYSGAMPELSEVYNVDSRILGTHTLDSNPNENIYKIANGIII